MIQSTALVDYEKFRPAKVAIFVDVTKAAASYAILTRHREAIGRITGLFSASVMLVEQGRLLPEEILENEVADAWILLRSDGPSRAMATKSNPQRINVDSKTGWELHAFKEIVRQIKESTQILDDVTDRYGRFIPPPDPAGREKLHPFRN